METLRHMAMTLELAPGHLEPAASEQTEGGQSQVPARGMADLRGNPPSRIFLPPPEFLCPVQFQCGRIR